MKHKSKKVQLVNYDPKVDVLYIATKSGSEEEFVEVVPGVQVELDQKHKVIGIEILNASRFFKPILKPLGEKVQLLKLA